MKLNSLIANARRLRRGFLESRSKPGFILSKLLLLVNTSFYFVKIPLIDGIKIYLHASKPSIHHLIQENYFREDMRFFRNFLTKGDVFVDVGANIGVISLMAAKAVLPEGRVFSFEPNPKVFCFLLENFRLNCIKEGCQQYQCALAEEDTTSYFYMRKYGDDLGSLSARTHQASRSVDVKVLRGDKVLHDLPQITLLKIDVEGAELRVLKGFVGLIDRIRFIVFETNFEMMHSHGLSFSELYDFLGSRGFKILSLSQGRPTELCRNSVVQNADLYAVRPNDTEEFLARVAKGCS